MTIIEAAQRAEGAADAGLWVAMLAMIFAGLFVFGTIAGDVISHYMETKRIKAEEKRHLKGEGA